MNQNTTKKTLLLIDDNKNLILTLTDFLTYEGFNIVSALSAEEALIRLEDLTPDLIILDINMPGMGGIRFLNKLEQEQQTHRYPIIVFTARAALEDFIETINIAGFIAKPCEEQDLLNKINEVLSNLQDSRAPESAPQPRQPTILLGEDDSNISRRVTRELDRLGFKYQIARTGAAVLEMAAATKPTIIIMKDILPGMNGHAVAPLIRAMPSTKTIPIVLYGETIFLQEDTDYSRTTPQNVTQYLTTNAIEPLIDAIKRHTL